MLFGSAPSPLRLLARTLLVAHAAGCAQRDAPPLDASLVGDRPLASEDVPAGDDGAPVNDSGAPVNDSGAPVSDSGAPVSDSSAPVTTTEGLPLVGRITLPGTFSGEAHLTQLLNVEGLLYGTNSFDGINVWRLNSDGSLAQVYAASPARTDPPPPAGTPPVPRCTTIAYHAPSSTLFCAAADRTDVGAWNVRDPASPVLRPDSQSGGEARAGYRALYVAGDTLFAAGVTRGLLASTLSPTGAHGPFAPAGVAGSAVTDVAGDGRALVFLDRARGLVSGAITAGGTVIERGAVALDGPPLSLAVHGDRAAVALGSQGVAMVNLGDGAPTISRRIETRCVATAADFSGDALAVSCTVGMLLYDLRGAAPRVAGYYPATNSMLDVRFVGDQVLGADWRVVDRFAVNLAGDALRVDMSYGVFVPRGSGVTLTARNVGGAPLHIGLFEDQRPLCPGGRCFRPLPAQPIGPHATTRVTLSAADLTSLANSFGLVQLRAATTEAGADPETAWPFGIFLQQPGAVVPALGEAFPTMTRAALAQGPTTIPAAGVASEVVFVTPDCALQWKQVEDLGWLATHRAMPEGRALYVLLVDPSLTPSPWIGAPFMEHFGLAGQPAGRMLDYVASLGGRGDPASVVDARFSTRAVGGPDNVANYVLDGAGRVEDVENIYRGRWPQRPSRAP